MDIAELEQIGREAAAAFTGLRLGKIFPLGKSALAIDLYPHAGEYLYIDIDPRIRSSYLIHRRLKELERASTHPTPFVNAVRRGFAGRVVEAISTPPGTKVLMIRFAAGEGSAASLAVQLGGSRPNIFILDEKSVILEAAYDDAVRGEGSVFVPPAEPPSGEKVRSTGGATLSELLDAEAREAEAESSFDLAAKEARKRINADIAKREKLLSNLRSDLAKQGDAAEWKRKGDLILANLSNLRRDGDRMILIDHFDPEQKEVAIDVDRNVAPSEAAEQFFKLYTKARNGALEISRRMASVEAEAAKLRSTLAEIETAIDLRDVEFLTGLAPAKKETALPEKKRKQKVEPLKGVRRFVSSDGMEILVGKKAADNDHLTFRIARSLDLWLHAADYPGSHVVVRDPNRKGVPNRTLTEAAELAAFYSDARSQGKAAVRYTQKKYVNKPRRSAPGLVSLASFKTILVEPKVGVSPASVE